MRFNPTPFLILALGACSLPCAGQSVYLRSSTPSGFVIESCANSTPLVCQTDAPHKLSDGDLITIVNVTGNKNANGVHYAKTAGYSNAQFALFSDAAMTMPIAGNGSYTHASGADYGIALGGKVASFTLRPQPVGWFDGPDGAVMKDMALSTTSGLTSLQVNSGVATVTTATPHGRKDGDNVGVWNSGDSKLNNNGTAYPVTVTDATHYSFPVKGVSSGDHTSAGVRISAFGHSANPVWAKLVVTSTNYTAGSAGNEAYRGFGGFGMESACAAMALRYLVDPSQTASRDGAIWCMNHFERGTGNQFACDESRSYCGNGDTDYLSFGLKSTGLVYSIIRNDLSSEERTTFLNKLYNDVEDGCARPSPNRYAVQSGAVQAGGATSVTLNADASGVDDFYTDNYVEILSGPGAGEFKLITAYSGSTKVATVAAWTVAPTTASTYRVIASLTTSGTTLTAKNTLFLTNPDLSQRVEVGDYIYTSYFGIATSYGSRVTAVLSDTQLTFLGGTGSAAPAHFWLVKQWKPGDCGAIWFTKHHPAHTAVSPADYPPTGGSILSAGADVGNTGYTKWMGALAVAIPTAADDPRALKYLQDTWTVYYDTGFRVGMNTHTGYTQSGGYYNFGRTGLDVPFMTFLAENSFAGFPDLGRTDSYIKGHLPFLIYSWYPDSTGGNGSSAFPMRWGTGAQNYITGYVVTALGIANPAVRLNYDQPLARNYMDWVRTKWKLPETGVYGEYLASFFFFLDPNIPSSDYTALPAQYLFRSTSYARCLSLMGDRCKPNWQYQGWVSRTGWSSPADTHLQVIGSDWYSGSKLNKANSFGGQDHERPLAGVYRLYKQGHFIATDSANPGNTTETLADVGNSIDNMFQLGTKDWGSLKGFAIGSDGESQILRWAGSDPGGPANGNYTYGLVDVTGMYRKDNSGNPLRAQRHVAHLKKPGTEELIVVYDDTKTASGVPHSVRLHYVNTSQNAWPLVGQQNAEGATVCDGGDCSTLNTTRKIVSQNALNTLVTRFYSPAANLRVFTETGPQCSGAQKSPDDGGTCTANQPGGYPGGRGYTFAVSYCASSDGASCDAAAKTMEAVVVHKISAGLADTELTATALNPDSKWTGVQTTDKVVLFARAGAANRSLNVTTSHTGAAEYLIAGLAAGTYDITMNGAAVSGSPFTVAPGDNTVYFESAAGTLVATAQGSASNLTVTPPVIALAGMSGAGDPAPELLTISSDGAPLTFAANSSASWLHLSGTEGMTPALLTVTADTAGLAPGTYEGALEIDSPEAGNGTVNLAVTLTIGDSSTALVVAPASIAFAPPGGANTASQPVSIGTTNSSTLTATVTAASTPNWLGVDHATVTTPSSVNVTANTGGLSPGVYLGTIQVTAPGAANSPLTLLAQLTVAPPPSALRINVTHAAARQVLVRYGRPGLDANQTCRVEWSDSADFSLLLGGWNDAGGAAIRETVIGDAAPLDAGRGYYVRADCGGSTGAASFATANALEAAGRVPVTLGPLPFAGVEIAALSYSEGGAGEQELLLPCSTGCSGSVPLSAGHLLRVRRRFLGSSGQLLGVGGTRTAVRP